MNLVWWQDNSVYLLEQNNDIECDWELLLDTGNKTSMFTVVKDEDDVVCILRYFTTQRLILFKTLRHKLTEMLQYRSGHKCYLKYNDITRSDDQSQEWVSVVILFLHTSQGNQIAFCPNMGFSNWLINIISIHLKW